MFSYNRYSANQYGYVTQYDRLGRPQRTINWLLFTKIYPKGDDSVHATYDIRMLKSITA